MSTRSHWFHAKEFPMRKTLIKKIACDDRRLDECDFIVREDEFVVHTHSHRSLSHRFAVAVMREAEHNVESESVTNDEPKIFECRNCFAHVGCLSTRPSSDAVDLHVHRRRISGRLNENRINKRRKQLNRFSFANRQICTTANRYSISCSVVHRHNRLAYDARANESDYNWIETRFRERPNFD